MGERVATSAKDKLRRPSGLLIPTALEIQRYLKKVSKRKPFDSKGSIGEETKGVRIINEEGEFLGFGETGRYDWFIQTHNRDGHKIADELMHHGNSSARYNMTTLRTEFHVETSELTKVTNEIIA